MPRIVTYGVVNVTCQVINSHFTRAHGSLLHRRLPYLQTSVLSLHTCPRIVTGVDVVVLAEFKTLTSHVPRIVTVCVCYLSFHTCPRIVTTITPIKKNLSENSHFTRAHESLPGLFRSVFQNSTALISHVPTDRYVCSWSCCVWVVKTSHFTRVHGSLLPWKSTIPKLLALLSFHTCPRIVTSKFWLTLTPMLTISHFTRAHESLLKEGYERFDHDWSLSFHTCPRIVTCSNCAYKS